MPDLESVYSAVADTAHDLGVPCDRNKLWPILRAYEAGFTSAAVALRTTTNARKSGELSVRYIAPAGDPDPYLLALDRNLTAKTNHSADRLYHEIQERGSVMLRGVDIGVTSGFEKIWCIYPDDGSQSVEAISQASAMPPSVRGNLSYFARHGLNDITGIAVDFRSQSVNIYFPFTETRDAEKISKMIGDLGLDIPNHDELERCGQAFSVYFSFTWDSPEIERICFPVRAPEASLVPSHLDPLMERFVKGARFDNEDRAYIYAIASSRSGPYYKIENFYYRPKPMIEADNRRNRQHRSVKRFEEEVPTI